MLWEAWVVPTTNTSLCKSEFWQKQQRWCLCPYGTLSAATGGNGGEAECSRWYLGYTQPGGQKGVATCWLQGLLMRPQHISIGNSQKPPGWILANNEKRGEPEKYCSMLLVLLYFYSQTLGMKGTDLRTPHLGCEFLEDRNHKLFISVLPTGSTTQSYSSHGSSVR